MAWSFGRVVFFVIPAVNSFLFEEFSSWAEVIVPETPGVGVEGVEGLDRVGIIKPVVSEEVSDTAPVFLFDMRVVVFLIGARPGE